MNLSKARLREQDVARILESLQLPPASDKPATSLILASGLPGSGKSTFCRRLAAEIDAVILESDALRRLLFDAPAFDAPESRRLFEALHEAARRLLQRGLTVIIDATSLRQADRLPAYEIAAQTGARLLLLRFEAPEHVIEQRLKGRSLAPHPADNSTAGIAVYRRLAETAEPLREAHWTIDTSDSEAAQSALREIVAACRAQPANNSDPELATSKRNLAGAASRRRGAAGTEGTVS
jgi:predicted kinase